MLIGPVEHQAAKFQGADSCAGLVYSLIRPNVPSTYLPKPDMVAESYPSPNAIPPRTSSTGLNTGFVAAAKPVLRPVSEADWISPSNKLHTTSMPSGPDPPRPVPNGILPGDGTTWSAEKEKILLGPYDYMVDHPGKDIRKRLISAFDVWLKVPEESLAVITKVIGMLHTASLLWVSQFHQR